MSTSFSSKILGPLAALLYLLVTQFEHQVNCYSTPSLASFPPGGGGGGGIGFSNSAANYGNEHKYGQDETGSEYTNNYITAIEDQSTQPAGFMVSTTDHNYAISSPRLGELDWLGLTVNGDQVFILTKENRTLSVNLFTLAESERDFIAETRAKFTQNLAGLRFAYYTSGSSLALAGPAAHRKPARYSSATGGGYYWAATEPVGHQTVASNTIGQLNNVNYLASLQEQRRRGLARGLPEPTGNGGPEDVTYSLGAVRLEPVDSFIAKRSRVNVPRGGHYLSAPEYKFARARGFKSARNKQHALARHSGGSSPHTASERLQANNNKTPQEQQYSKCSYQNLVNLNYYNLENNRQTEKGAGKLNTTLAGDIYYFDFHCNILDVYSSTVSVRRQPDASILYRDHRYFSYSRSQLPLEINRLFLAGDQVFFVYNDGSLVLKQSWMLDPAELDLVLGVRKELKGVSEWQARAAELTSNKGDTSESTTLAPEVTTTEKPADH